MSALLLLPPMRGGDQDDAERPRRRAGRSEAPAYVAHVVLVCQGPVPGESSPPSRLHWGPPTPGAAGWFGQDAPHRGGERGKPS
eukprot:scaffold4477_cov417-Prasinococcus_capsulatus_cf.AAC.3